MKPYRRPAQQHCTAHGTDARRLTALIIVATFGASIDRMGRVVGTVPYPLFWLRYSLFIVLYPSGISGELIQVPWSRHICAGTAALAAQHVVLWL